MQFDDIQALAATERNTESTRCFELVPAAGKARITSYEEYRISAVVDEINRKAANEARRHRRRVARIKLVAIEDDVDDAELSDAHTASSAAKIADIVVA